MISSQPRYFLRVLRIGSAAQFLCMAVSGAMSVVFWIAVATRLSPGVVGRSTSVMSVVLAALFVANFGLAPMVARWGHDGNSRRPVLALAGLIAVAGGVVATASAISLIPSPGTAAAKQAGLLGMCAVVAGTAALAPLVDVWLMTERRWTALVGRTVVSVIIRLIALVVILRETISNPTIVALFALLGEAVTGVVCWSALTGSTWRSPSRIVSVATAQMVTFCAASWLGTVASQAPIVLTPVIIASIVSPAENAVFYLCWGAASGIYMTAQAIGRAYLAHGDGNTDSTHHQRRVAERFAVSAAVICAALSVPAALIAARLLDATYSPLRIILPLLAAAAVPWSVLQIRVTSEIIRRNHLRIVSTSLWIGLGVLTATTLGALVARSSGGAVGFFLGTVIVVLISGRLESAYISARRDVVDVRCSSPQSAGVDRG